MQSTDTSFFFPVSSGNSQSAEQELGRVGAAEGEGGGHAETAGEPAGRRCCSLTAATQTHGRSGEAEGGGGRGGGGGLLLFKPHVADLFLLVVIFQEDVRTVTSQCRSRFLSRNTINQPLSEETGKLAFLK